jgi:hypothetical protein
MSQLREEYTAELLQKQAKGEHVKLEGPMFEYQLKMKTHEHLMKLELYNKNAEKYRLANERREKEEEAKKKYEEKKQEEDEKKVRLIDFYCI